MLLACRNAITHVCLAGFAKQLEQKECLHALQSNGDCNFVILFSSEQNLTFRGLYRLEHDQESNSFMVCPAARH